MKRTKNGFTLVELLVVIAILAILATVSVVGYTNFINRANDSVAQQELTQIRDYYIAGQFLVPPVVVSDELLDDLGLEGTIEEGKVDGKICYRYTSKGTAYWFKDTNEVVGGVEGWVATEALNQFEGKVISILGDSISTFGGYIPTADGFNLYHRPRYPQDDLLTDVNETWWMQVIHELGAKLGINDSWAGSCVSNHMNGNSGDLGKDACMASLTRIQNLGSNGTPDIILFYGGTNDIGHSIKLGSFNTQDAPTEADLTSYKWDTFVSAYTEAILRMRYYYPDAVIIAMLPTYTVGYYSDERLAQYNAEMSKICEHYGIPYIDLRYCGINTSNLPDKIHPNAEGMDYISKAVIEKFKSESDIEAGENVVHSVKHNLENACSSLSYYKGVSHGKSFTTTVRGNLEGEMSVNVTMGGVDITTSSYDIDNGVINISEVIGDIVIDVRVEVNGIQYPEQLQELPEELTASTNLWIELTPDEGYYTEDGKFDSKGTNPNTIPSITIPVSSGYKIDAYSFGAAGKNGSASSYGIRITYFKADGTKITFAPREVYNEYSGNGGYIIVPDGAVAINIPMWNESDKNYVYILNS